MSNTCKLNYTVATLISKNSDTNTNKESRYQVYNLLRFKALVKLAMVVLELY